MGDDGLGADDRAELAARFAAIAGEAAESALDLLIGHLTELETRQVPVRRIDAGPVAGTARLSFADGTRVIAHGVPAGALAKTALDVVQRRAVCVRGLARQPGAIAGELVSDRGRRVSVLILGPDQSD